MMNLNELKNDTQRKNVIREELARLVNSCMVENFGDENVVEIKDKITLNDSDISGQTIAVKVGTVIVDGQETDVIATISATVKAWKTSRNKTGRVTYAVSLDDIIEEVEIEAEARREKKEAKEKAKAEKIEKDKKARTEKAK